MQGAVEGWAEFTQDILQNYDVDMSCLDIPYRQEQEEYYLETSAWADIHPSQLLGPACFFKEYDLLTVSLEELTAPLQVFALISLWNCLCRCSDVHQRLHALVHALVACIVRVYHILVADNFVSRND